MIQIPFHINYGIVISDANIYTSAEVSVSTEIIRADVGTRPKHGSVILFGALMFDCLGKNVLVYDVGGTNVSAAVCSGGDYRLGPVSQLPYTGIETPEAFAELIELLAVRSLQSGVPVAGAALAFPGPFDFASGISRMRHKLPYLYGIDLRAEFSRRLGLEPASIRFLHDAPAFLLGEISVGSARGVNRVVGMTLGTGIGSAFAANGRIVSSGPGIPPQGEVWNLPFRDGILEDAVSSRAIRLSYEIRTGRTREVVDIAAAAAVDADAAKAFSDFGQHLGQAMRQILAEFAPDAVVLGGSISRSASLFLPSAERELGGLPFELRISALFDHAALVGAASAWFNETSASGGKAVTFAGNSLYPDAL